MKILIHRGSNEIGGTCIQLSTNTTTILLDFGLPLSDRIPKTASYPKKPDSVLISHPHQDHFGLIDTLDPDVPVYIGELGKHLIDATRILLGKKLHDNNFKYFKSWEPFHIGDFTITPYLVDHSAADAYGFLIEAGGKRVFYSGDFRAHGRKSSVFEKFIKYPHKDIDLLFMEGTMMQRTNCDFPSETDVEEKILDTIKNQENISFLICSSQNIDRIVSAYRACLRSGKILIIDIYTAWVLEQTKKISDHVPTMGWDSIGVYAHFSQDNTLKESPDFFGDFRSRLYKHRIKKEEIKANPSNFLYVTKMSRFKEINLYKQTQPIHVIYSQWLGYLEYTNQDYFGSEAVAAYRNDSMVDFVYAHTSGHATIDDLQRFAQALSPKHLVPIHTEHRSFYSRYFKNVAVLEDNVEYGFTETGRLSSSLI